MTSTITNALPVGAHHDIAPRDYHAWAFDRESPAHGPISCSLLKQYAEKGPVSFRYGPPRDKPSAAMSWGSLVDCLLFTPHLFPREFVLREDCPDLSADGGFRTKAAKEWRDIQLESGSTIISEDLKAQAETAIERMRDTPICAEILDGATYQLALVTESAGMPVKCLLDCVPSHLDHDDALVDLKTTSVNIYDDDALSRQIGSLRYDWQAAMYLHAWNTLHPDDVRRKWRLIFQSSTPPYESRVVELDDLQLDAGKAAVKFWLPRLIRDMRTAFISPFRTQVTTLAPHNPTIYANEAKMELLENLAA